MANALFHNYRNLILGGGNGTAPDLNGGQMQLALIDSAVLTVLLDTHETYNQVSTAVVDAPSANLTCSVGVVGVGVFDHQDETLPLVNGDQAEQILYFNNTGTPTTSILVCLFDQFASGMPVTPTGNDIDVQPATSGVFVI